MELKPTDRLKTVGVAGSQRTADKSNSKSTSSYQKEYGIRRRALQKNQIQRMEDKKEYDKHYSVVKRIAKQHGMSVVSLHLVEYYCFASFRLDLCFLQLHEFSRLPS